MTRLGWLPAFAAIALLLLAWPPASARAQAPQAPSAATDSSAVMAPQAPGLEPAQGRTLVVHVPSAADSARMQAGLQGAAFRERLARADSAVVARGGSRAENAQLFLSWNAPWGMRGASTTRMPACGDSSRADTLYLSFYAGRRVEYFTGATAELKFLATGSDTLGPWWHMESKGGENGGNMRVEWGPSPDMPGPQPWPQEGHGFALLDHTPGALRLRLLCAMPLEQAQPIDSTVTYTLCRVILKHRPARRLAGCEQAVCVEWTKATFGFALKDEPEVRRGERFVGYGPSRAVCEPFHQAQVQAWKPKAPRLHRAPCRSRS